MSMLNNKQYQNFPFYATNWKQVQSLLFNHEKVIMRKEHSLQARNRNPFIIMFHSATTDLEDKKKEKNNSRAFKRSNFTLEPLIPSRYLWLLPLPSLSCSMQYSLTFKSSIPTYSKRCNRETYLTQCLQHRPQKTLKIWKNPLVNLL